ncbi:MAG: acyltransferase [Fibrella sp.]|nr:acyltransferase [Armatimonadota bacterium]
MNNRVHGLDTIRFVCALWVFLGHTGGPFPNPDNIVEKLVRSFFMGAINAPAAVIIFFLISGFCIHYPFRANRPIELTSFYSRRLIRILLPVFAMLLLSYPIGYRIPEGGIQNTVLWSIFAEITYYIIYPVVLLPLRRRVGWRPIVIASFLIGFVLASTKPEAINYIDLGLAWTWLLGLPCWLLGCVLAERSDSLTAETRQRISIWLWRLSVLVVSAVTSLMLWHPLFGLRVGFPWTLNLFGIYAYFWLSQEIIHFRKHKPNALLEAGGIWSYSLYLMHVPAIIFFKSLTFLHRGLSSELLWLLEVILTLVVSYVFFKIAEQPSQALASFVGKKLSPKATG